MRILGSSSIKRRGTIKQIRSEQFEIFFKKQNCMASHRVLLEICSVCYWAFKRSCDFVSWSRVPDFLMTSITAYLTALAHSSSKQRVLKADIQTSTGDTDVCRQKCIVSVFKRRRLERCEHCRCCCCNAPSFRHQRHHLNCCDSGVDLMILAGMFGENSQGSQ